MNTPVGPPSVDDLARRWFCHSRQGLHSRKSTLNLAGVAGARIAGWDVPVGPLPESWRLSYPAHLLPGPDASGPNEIDGAEIGHASDVGGILGEAGPLAGEMPDILWH